MDGIVSGEKVSCDKIQGVYVNANLLIFFF